MSRDTTIARKGSPVPIPTVTFEQAGPAPRWARPAVTADYIGTTPDVLARWRYLRKGPNYILPPGVRSVLYDLNDVDRWLLAGRVETSESAQAAQGQTSGRAA